MMARPRVSIVIPTHNRAGSLARTLTALGDGTFPSDSVEAIVVADGCTDATAHTVLGRSWRLPVRLLQQEAAGPAAARNRGAAAATGDLLIFLDDDIEPSREFVAAHVRAHEEADAQPSVVIGYLPPEVQGRSDLFAIMLRAWWEAMFERMRDPGHRFAYSDLLSGNFSVGAEFFRQVGGFDESLRCHEDYELGLRLIGAGARLAFAAEAAGRHHEHTDLARALGRKREEGRADVALARLHPALAPALPLSATHRHLTRRGRLLKKLAFVSPAAGDVLETACRGLLGTLESLKLRGRWRRLLDDLLSYWYWRGVGESLDGASVASVRGAAAAAADPPSLDLRIGLRAAMIHLDATRPEAVQLRWGALVIGTVPPQPGAERLAGRHLPALLRTRFADAFEETLANADVLTLDAAGHVTAGYHVQEARQG